MVLRISRYNLFKAVRIIYIMKCFTKVMITLTTWLVKIVPQFHQKNFNPTKELSHSNFRRLLYRPPSDSVNWPVLCANLKWPIYFPFTRRETFTQ